MPDVLANGRLGYNCEACDAAFQVQYAWDDPDEEADETAYFHWEDATDV